MTTPFDTTRLDEECERIARQMRDDSECIWAPNSETVRRVLLDEVNRRHECGAVFVGAILERCRRPKMVPA
jgi:hypothetical protein